MQLFNKAVVAVLPALPVSIVRRFANRYIAGETVADAVSSVRSLMAENCCATLTILGEHVTDKTKANQTVDQYIQLLDTIAKENLDSNRSSVLRIAHSVALLPESDRKPNWSTLERP